jgi:hypothetical protein
MASSCQLSATGGGYIAFYVCAPRTRAIFLSPRPIRGLFWLLNGRRHKMSAAADRRHPRCCLGSCCKEDAYRERLVRSCCRSLATSSAKGPV